ncbi:hypothetical protein [Marinibacterium profundimaris]|uniref:hypothetical protein n=1 Tax=Marinibacterium profundimaris TaxID=1679460 RepID=UPI00117C99A5|nr:hypothetical protein [Marinibacterium profundimaris]
MSLHSVLTILRSLLVVALILAAMPWKTGSSGPRLGEGAPRLEVAQDGGDSLMPRPVLPQAERSAKKDVTADSDCGTLPSGAHPSPVLRMALAGGTAARLWREMPTSLRPEPRAPPQTT